MELRQLHRRPQTPPQTPLRLLPDSDSFSSSSCSYNFSRGHINFLNYHPGALHGCVWVCVCVGSVQGRTAEGWGQEGGKLALLLAHWGRVQPSATWEARGKRGNRTAMWNGNAAALPPRTSIPSYPLPCSTPFNTALPRRALGCHWHWLSARQCVVSVRCMLHGYVHRHTHIQHIHTHTLSHTHSQTVRIRNGAQAAGNTRQYFA